MEKSNLLLPNNNYQYLENINKNIEFKMCINNLIEYTNEDRYMLDFFSNPNNPIEIWNEEHISYIVDKFKQISKIDKKDVYKCIREMVAENPDKFCDGKFTEDVIESMMIILNILDISINTETVKNKRVARKNYNELVKRSSPYIKIIIRKSISLSKHLETTFCNRDSKGDSNGYSKGAIKLENKDKERYMFIEDMNIYNPFKNSFISDFFEFIKKSIKTLSTLDPNNSMHKIIMLSFFGLILYLLFSLFKININYNLT